MSKFRKSGSGRLKKIVSIFNIYRKISKKNPFIKVKEIKFNLEKKV